jgi:hypothetical protein
LPNIARHPDVIGFEGRESLGFPVAALPSKRNVGGDPVELKDEFEPVVTRSKLKLLEQRLEASRVEPAQNPRVQELTLRSLKRMINQLKEEITRYESHAMHGSAS